MPFQPFSKNFAHVSALSPDPRIQVFRSFFSAPGEFDNMSVDAYVIMTERFVVFCDTLLCPADMQQVCKILEGQMRDRQLLVINSHADWDHVWGNHYLSEQFAPVIIGQEHCRTRLLSDAEAQIVSEYQEKFPIFRPVVLVPPGLTFRDSLTIQGGDLTLELFSAPGHQPDQSVLWIPEISVLLAFDAVEYPFPGIGSPELVAEMFHSLERLQKLQAATILYSHGSNRAPGLIERNLHYLHEIERRSRALLARQAVNAEQLTDPAQLIGYPYAEVVADVQEPIDHTYYEDTHTENIRHILRWLLTIA